MGATAFWKASSRSTPRQIPRPARAHLRRHRRLHDAFAAIFSTMNTKNCLSSVYRIPAIHIDVKMVLTNAAPLGPYRGAGRPEAIYLIERLIDEAARAMNIDRAALRRRNLIPPSAMPYKTPNGPIYDSGEFEAATGQGAGARRLEGLSARRGSRSGTENCAASASAASSKSRAAFSTKPSTCGSSRTARWHCAPACRRWGRDICRPSCIGGAAARHRRRTCSSFEGDSDEVPDGTPSVASRSIMMAGSATAIACDHAIEKGRRGAAQLFEADADDIDFADGAFGSPEPTA